jgi:HEAT repeat protein
MRSQPTANSNDSTALAKPLRQDSQKSLSHCRFADDSTRSTEPRGARSLMVVLSLALVLIFFAAAIPAPIRAAWDEFSLRMQLQQQSEPQAASPSKLSDHEIEELANLPAQQQAERLLERAVNHYDGALELIGKSVDNWVGQLELQGQLPSLLTTALNSNDLHVRAVALEIELAAYNLPKRADSADTLIERIRREPAARPWALWMLGVLGNRGVETRRAFVTLMDHRHDPDEQTRYWAVEGLSLLGTDETVAPLLEAFRGDPSPLVRERGGCGLAQSGMLTREQRLRAVPDLLKMTDDKTLDDSTRGWVFQALRDITGASIAADSAAWRAWWAQHRADFRG